MNRAFLQQVENSPVIAAVRDEKALEQSLSSEVGIVFLLGFDIISLPEMTEKVRKAGKLPVVHLDLVAGLSPREEAVRYLREKTAAGGIITTKANLILCAQHMGLGTIRSCRGYWTGESFAASGMNSISPSSAAASSTTARM